MQAPADVVPELLIGAAVDVVVRGEYDDAGTYMLERGEVFDASTGQYLGMARGSEYEGTLQATRLRVVRVDADGGDEPDNLLLLCRWCLIRLTAQHRQSTN